MNVHAPTYVRALRLGIPGLFLTLVGCATGGLSNAPLPTRTSSELGAEAAASPPTAVPESGNTKVTHLDVAGWRLMKDQSGPVNYYTVVTDPVMPFIRAEYKPGMSTSVLGAQMPDADRATASHLKWSWRAVTLPKDGDECTGGKTDSAASLYVSWKHTIKWNVIKFVWSSVGTKGALCGKKRNPFVSQDTVILESGGPLNTWKEEDIDLRAEYRKHFENGNPNADVPDFMGLGIMSDGDQTQSESSADYAAFSVTH